MWLEGIISYKDCFSTPLLIPLWKHWGLFCLEIHSIVEAELMEARARMGLTNWQDSQFERRLSALPLRDSGRYIGGFSNLLFDVCDGHPGLAESHWLVCCGQEYARW